MNRAWRWRLAFACATAAAAACVPILGLDDLEPRPVTKADAGPDTNVPPVDTNPCTKHAECIERANQFPARCVKNRCVNVDTELCNQQTYPNPELLKREDTIVIAAFMPGANPAISGSGKAFTLALEEIETAGGILGSPQYHLAMIVCNSESEFAERGVKHVINDLQLPAVIASFGTGDLASLVAGDLADAGVFTMNPSFTTDFLKAARVNRRVWGLLGTGEDVALAYKPVLDELRAQKMIRADAKVALVSTNGSLDKPMAELVEKGQVNSAFDGGRDPSKAIKMVDGSTPAQDPDHFRRFSIESLETATDKKKFEDEIAALITNLTAFEPDVIIALTGSELGSFLTQVDKKLFDLYASRANAGLDASDDGGAPQKGPWWILGPSNGELTDRGARTPLGNYLIPSDAGQVDPRRERILGVQFAGALDQSDAGQAGQYRKRITDKYKAAASDALASENFYDAIYWLAYGIVAAGPDAPVNGDSFSSGVRKLFKGSPEINPGDTDTVQRGFGELLKPDLDQNGNIYVGALGPPAIDEATGTWNSVGSTYCYPPNGQNLPAPSYEIRRYSRADGGGLLPITIDTKPLTCN